MKVAVVILNWNGVDMLRRYLPGVLEFSREEAEVIVADNASTDDSLALLKEQFPEVRTILLDRNYGFAEGYNKALAQVDAAYYVLLNSDVEVTHHWLTPLVEYMDYHQEVAACQPKLLSARNKDAFEYAGASGGFLDKYGYPFCRGRVFDVVEEDRGQYDYASDVMWATGACLFVRSKDFWAVDGFDGRFFAHNEEIDLCWRLRLAGKRVCCLPESAVYHWGGGTLPKSNPMKTYLNFRNNLAMLYKNLPEERLGRVMRVRWWLDRVAALKALLVDRRWGEFRAIMRARKDFALWRHDLKADREAVGKGKAVVSVRIQEDYSLLWLFYVKGLRHFSQFPQSVYERQKKG